MQGDMVIRRPLPDVPKELRCIDNLAPKGSWVIKLGTKKYNMDYLHQNDVWNRRSIFNHGGEIFVTQKPCALDGIEHYLIYGVINQYPLRYFKYMQEECIGDSMLLIGFAETLSGPSVDKICRHVFKKEDGVSLDFVKLFYKYFIPAYLNRKYNWYSLSLLVRASIAYPEYFELLVQDLLQDIDAPNNILLDFAATLNAEKKNNMMKVVTKINMNNVQFCNNLKFICCLLTDCERTTEIDDYLSMHLEFHANYCSLNNDYGRLLVVFLKNITSFAVRQSVVWKLIEIHGTTYKSACITILGGILTEALQLQQEGGVRRMRFLVPRERRQNML